MTKKRNQPGLRLMIYDATEKRWGRFINLSTIWRTGAGIYGLLNRFDDYYGAANWHDALSWLGRVKLPEPISEIQFWGHGKWGRALISDESLDTHSLDPHHCLHQHLQMIRTRLVANGLIREQPALWWFRTCETIGAICGQQFARDWANFFECRVAGHTHAISFYQSGLHSLRPGESPGWSGNEGILEGDTHNPLRSAESKREAPNTITCFDGRVPDGW